MKVGPLYRLPDELHDIEARARHLEYWTIGALLSIVAVVYWAMGSSQAMKTAWVEDVLSLVPPTVYLIAAHRRRHPPDVRFPYGYQKAMALSFLAAAVALTLLGVYMVYDALGSLVAQEHPTLGRRTVFGANVWSGWIMIGALIYSAIPPIILGHLKKPVAAQLHHKTLAADADMNKADWMTAGTGIAGIVGVGLGFWWADSVAALIISLAILQDGASNARDAFSEVMDQRPTTMDGKLNADVVDAAADALRGLAWVRAADVRLRDEGETVTGEGFVVPDGPGVSVVQLEEARRAVEGAHWRLHDITVTAVDSLD